MNCIDKGIESMKSLGYTHFSNIPNVQVYINRQHECMLSLMDKLTNKAAKQDQEKEKEHHESPTKDSAQEFVLFGGEVIVNSYFNSTVVDELYRLSSDREMSMRVNAICMAIAYLECFPSKRVVILNM